MKHCHIKVVSVDSCINALTGTTNCIIIWRRGVAVVVDPGGGGAKLTRILKRNRLTVAEYWLTHAHPDHVSGLSDLFDEFPAPIRYHRGDQSWLLCPPILGLRMRQSEWFIPFGGIRNIECGDIVAKVISTPGHSKGSVCYWFEGENILISGDTLMKDCIGATCYPGGDEAALNASLRKIFRRIPDDVKVIPGHGRSTTIGAERP